MVLLCKSNKNGVFGGILRVPPQQSIENARHFMPCTACMSMNCSSEALQHAACMHRRDLNTAHGSLPRARRDSMCCAQPAAQQRGIARAWLEERGFMKKIIRKSYEKRVKTAAEAPQEGKKGLGIRTGRPRWTTRVPRGAPRATQSGPRPAQVRPRLPKEWPRAAPERPKSGQDRPKST